MGAFRKQIKISDEIKQTLISDCPEMMFGFILEEGGLKIDRIAKTLLCIFKTGKGNKDYYTTKSISGYR
jgi:hypothetical protein